MAVLSDPAALDALARHISGHADDLRVHASRLAAGAETVRWQLRLMCGGLPGARWVAPENLHITLRFIGEVDGREFHDIDAALEEPD